MKQSFSYKNFNFWIFFVILFSSGFVFFKVPFEFYFHYIILILLIPYFLIKYGFPKFLIQIFTIPLIIGLIHIILGNNSTFTFFKVYGGLVITCVFFDNWIRHYNFNITLIFEAYCRSCWILIVIAIIQIFSFIIGFEKGYDFSWFLNKWGFVEGGLIGFRVNSILPEPTYLATSLSPAVYVSIRNLIKKQNFIFSNIQSIIVIIISILTTSTIGYLGILISVILSLEISRFRYLLFALLISIGGYFVAYNNVSDFSSRINSAKGLWIEKDFKIDNTNNSSFVLYNNLHVAKENLLIYPFFGTGLGSHENAFKKFTLTKSLIQYDFEFNVKDGNSLFIRLCSETGLIGLLFVLFLIFKCFIKSTKPELAVHKIISQSLFILLVLSLVRQGNYMLNGLPIIFLLYYFNFVEYNKRSNLEIQ